MIMKIFFIPVCVMSFKILFYTRYINQYDTTKEKRRILLQSSSLAMTLSRSLSAMDIFQITLLHYYELVNAPMVYLVHTLTHTHTQCRNRLPQYAALVARARTNERTNSKQRNSPAAKNQISASKFICNRFCVLKGNDSE